MGTHTVSTKLRFRFTFQYIRSADKSNAIHMGVTGATTAAVKNIDPLKVRC